MNDKRRTLFPLFHRQGRWLNEALLQGLTGFPVLTLARRRLLAREDGKRNQAGSQNLQDLSSFTDSRILSLLIDKTEMIGVLRLKKVFWEAEERP